jgi:alkylation response protein AidB-like acyl-CoA dehydrogenase
LEGYSPWVTGAEFAQHIVLGATLGDGRQILVALPTDLPGVRIERSPRLVGLSASRTGPVYCDRVFVPTKWLLAGPVQEVMKQGQAKTGGLQTSALAIGLMMPPSSMSSIRRCEINPGRAGRSPAGGSR